MQIKARALTLNVNLRNDVYVLGFDGGTGKSYTYEVLSDLADNEKQPFMAVTYQKDFNENKFIQQYYEEQPELVFMDRFDLYITESLCEFLRKNQSKSVFLLDLKSMMLLSKVTPMIAKVDFSKGVINYDYDV